MARCATPPSTASRRPNGRRCAPTSTGCCGGREPREARAMLIDFFLHLRHSKLPVSIKEYLLLLEGMREHVIGPSIDDFYYLSRATLVKDERNFDKFDKAFAAYFKGRSEEHTSELQSRENL